MIRWIHRIWKSLRNALLILILIALTGGAILLAILQLPPARTWIAEQITEQFNERYDGTLEIGRISGLLPVQTVLYQVEVLSTGDMPVPVLLVEEVHIDLHIWDLLRRNVTVNGFELHRPEFQILFDEEGDNLFLSAFRNRSDSIEAEPGSIHFYAPNLQILEGRIYVESPALRHTSGELDEHFLMEDLNASLFLEWNNIYQLLDIQELRTRFPGTGWGEVNMSGQLFSEEELLEANGFSLSTEGTDLNFSGRLSPFNILDGGSTASIASSQWRLIFEPSTLSSQHLSALLPEFPQSGRVLDFELLADGNAGELRVQMARGSFGEGSFQLRGHASGLDSGSIQYQTEIGSLIPDSWLVREIAPGFISEQGSEILGQSEITGQLGGTGRVLDAALTLQTPNGSLSLDGTGGFSESEPYNLNLRANQFDLSGFSETWVDSSLVTGNVQLAGNGMNPESLQLELNASLDNGYLNRVRYNDLSLQLQADGSRWEHELRLNQENSSLHTRGVLSRPNGTWNSVLNASAEQLNLSDFLNYAAVPDTRLTFDLNSEVEGEDWDGLFGRIGYQAEESVVAGDTLRPHQFYLDLDPSGNGSRVLRLTSTFMDAELEGDIYPEQLSRSWNWWKEDLIHRFYSEIAFESQEQPNTILPEIERSELSLTADLKDLNLLSSWIGQPMDLGSRAHIEGYLNSTPEQLLMTLNVTDPEFQKGTLEAESLHAQVTAGIRHGVPLSEYSTLDLQVRAQSLSSGDFTFRSPLLNTSLRNGALDLHHSSRSSNEEISLELTLASQLLEDRIESELSLFHFSNGSFDWQLQGEPTITWQSGRLLHIDDLSLANGEEEVEISGTYSSRDEDQVEYRVNRFQLEQISEFLDGRVTFSGELNGHFSTSTLGQIPSIDGDLNVRRFLLMDRLVGDVDVASRYNSGENRFDTRITVLTDPDRYAGYLEENDEIGQNLILDGYIRGPDPDNPDADLYYFDADFREIDMWIVPVIVPDIVLEMEGRSSGSGFIRGNLNDYDFHTEFDIDEVYGRPAFVNTEYSIGGRLLFNRSSGLVFEQIELQDEEGGQALLTGSVDLNDFDVTKYLNLTLEMNNLRFMDNPYNPDIPFFANIRGSGRVDLTGTNISPMLRTPDPIRIGGDSRVSVPLLDETELQQTHKFIRFVDHFDLQQIREEELQNEFGEGGVGFQFDPETLTFIERFTLDLQFTAEEPVTFNLIFDQVTNEILTASGTGQIRLTLEDQNFSIFGRMNIEGGEYQFVAGDIISRRFQLQDGGSILWEGDPENARLNVSANYRARPDLTSLISTPANRNLETTQRFPVDLVLEIGGTIATIENEFFFQLPSGIEGTLDPTLASQINSLNRNEEEKVVQATSILLTGNFIPTSSINTGQGTGEAFRQSIPAGGSVVVNPLLSSQVINPLLSDQINSLLRSDMALDIDFSLTPYNQIDLGVALSLYDDRLILRREGQITGLQNETGIGDLGATYRISRIWAITAFHRQDPTLANTSGQDSRQAQEMNGIGVEAQVQFNSWQEISRRIVNAVRTFFGRKESDEELADTGNIDT
ncbi:MAG: hypothetical protein WDZ29_00875 [Balneolaceae bacterium]